jgi:2-desacetyl-2-hydroxyethyl bacteriochlorophyllide A dehydrogenase
MKAARIWGPLDIRYEEVPDPSPGPKEVLVRIKAEGVCGSDLVLLKGDYPYIKSGLTKYPFTPGHEWSGIVVDLGPEVKGFAIGDSVVGEPSLGCGSCYRCLGGRYDLCPQRQEVGSLRNKDGGYSEYIVMPALHLYKVPPNISLEAAALVEPAADAVYALQKAKISGASLVVILGDGTMGLLALQTAKAFGAIHVLLAGVSDFKLSVGQSLGSDDIVNVRKDDLSKRVMELSQGVGADVVVEASGDSQSIANAVYLVKPGGEIVVIGIYGTALVPFDMTTLVVKDAVLIGSHVSPNCFIPTLNLIATGKISTTQLITHRFPLAAVHDALKAQERLEEERIKIIVLPEG